MLLGVNIDHIATLRQARRTRYPDPVYAASLAEQGGADSITVHLREDRRHIQDRDIRLLSETLQVPMNLEMAVSEEILTFATEIKPQFCCLVPERREELTTEGGLDVAGQFDQIAAACTRLKEAGIRVSLFIDADPKQIEASGKLGAEVVELHTGHYADSQSSQETEAELKKIIVGVMQATTLGLQVNAGHGLNYQNVSAIASIPQIQELNIGHSIVARAVFSGLEQAVTAMKAIINEARRKVGVTAVSNAATTNQ